MSTFNITIREDRTVEIPSNICWGCVNENEIINLHFVLPENINDIPLSEFAKYIDIINADNNMNKETIELNNCDCLINDNITQYQNLYAQIILKKLISENEYMTWKSEIFSIHFEDSINATEEINIIVGGDI